MKFKVCFKLNGEKKRPVLTNYRPTWTCESKPDHNSGALVFDDIDAINPGEGHICFLHPLAPEFWNDVKLYHSLDCMEGSRVVGTAFVLERLD